MDFFDWITQIDLNGVRFVREHMTCAFLDFVMPVVTNLGYKGILSIVLAVILIAVNKGKSRKAGLVMLTAIALGFVFGNLVLKPLVMRQRPSWIDSVSLLVHNPSDFSFPSGHSLCAFETAVPICMYFGKKWGVVALTLALLVAFSRLYLYVHFPTDIICGALLGTAFAFVSKAIWDFVQRKKGLSL